MAATYQSPSPCQCQPSEESCISGIITSHPNQANTMLLPEPFHVINPSFYLFYSPYALSQQVQVQPNNPSSPGILHCTIKFKGWLTVSRRTQQLRRTGMRRRRKVIGSSMGTRRRWRGENKTKKKKEEEVIKVSESSSYPGKHTTRTYRNQTSKAIVEGK